MEAARRAGMAESCEHDQQDGYRRQSKDRRVQRIDLKEHRPKQTRGGDYLAVQPGPAHRNLLQLSPADFIAATTSGLPLIHENALRLWTEAEELSRMGPRRGVSILQGFAEEEATISRTYVKHYVGPAIQAKIRETVVHLYQAKRVIQATARWKLHLTQESNAGPRHEERSRCICRRRISPR